MIDENEQEIRKWITAYKNRSARRYSYDRLLEENFISQPAVFIRRRAFDAAGLLDIGLPTAMDYDLWLRLAKLSMPGFIDHDLACFRVQGQSISANNFGKQFAEQYRIHQRYDDDRWRLAKHRVKNQLIVFTYAVIEKSRMFFREGN
jgi:GT2 family glycosyltransferase